MNPKQGAEQGRESSDTLHPLSAPLSPRVQRCEGDKRTYVKVQSDAITEVLSWEGAMEEDEHS